jgi:hypothetical protein
MFVGEQPGDQEDRQGKPFVDPAGKVLDAALIDAGIDRARVYVTNRRKTFQMGASRETADPQETECHRNSRVPSVATSGDFRTSSGDYRLSGARARRPYWGHLFESPSAGENFLTCPSPPW